MLFVEISAQVVAQKDGPYYREWPDVGVLLERKRPQQLGRFDLRIVDERRHGCATLAPGRWQAWGRKREMEKPAYFGVIDNADGPGCQAEMWVVKNETRRITLECVNRRATNKKMWDAMCTFSPVRRQPSTFWAPAPLRRVPVLIGARTQRSLPKHPTPAQRKSIAKRTPRLPRCKREPSLDALKTSW